LGIHLDRWKHAKNPYQLVILAGYVAISYL